FRGPKTLANLLRLVWLRSRSPLIQQTRRHDGDVATILPVSNRHRGLPAGLAQGDAVPPRRLGRCQRFRFADIGLSRSWPGAPHARQDARYQRPDLSVADPEDAQGTVRAADGGQA